MDTVAKEGNLIYIWKIYLDMENEFKYGNCS
jgi:hypothetical protein